MKRLFALALAWVSVAAFAQITYTDYSGSITTGGTSQTLAAASNGRVRIAILNPATETENLCVNLTVAASCTPGSSWILQSGQSVVIDSTEAVTVVAATTGHKWIAKAGVGPGFAANGGGSGSGGGGGASTIADGADATQGAKADSVCATDTGTCTVTALLKKANANLTTLAGSNAQLPTALGATTASGSLSVVNATDATAIVAQGSTTSGQKGNLIQGAVTTAAPSYTTAQTSPLSLDTSGNLRVSGSFSALDAGSFTGTCSSSCNGTTLVAWTTDGYQSAEIQVTSAGTGATFSWQCSSDNVTFTGCNGFAVGSTGSSGAASASTGAVGQFCIPAFSRYMRVQMTGYSSGTVTVQGYQRSKSGCGGIVVSTNVVNTVTTSTSGSVAQGGTAANPLGLGLEARTTTPTATTTGQMTRAQGSTDGKLVTLIGGVPELSWTYAAAGSGISNTTTAVTIKAAGTDRLYLTRLDLMCEALGTATEVAVRDGAGGTVLWRTKVGTGGLPLTNISFATPLKGTSATLMEVVTLTASGTGACYFNAAGYDAK